MIELIKKSIEEKESLPLLFKRNLVKEHLQMLVLSFLYSKKEYRNLIFYGGSCLRHCFNLQRLSEDLDFVDIKDEVNLKNLAQDIENFFKKKAGIKITSKIQKFRILLKFPILYNLGLAKPPESNLLFLKVEIFKEFGFCKKYKIEILPLFKFGEAMLVRSFDLPTLMATKIRAIFYRKWEKTDREGKILAKVKGRDYYDLMWYLEKKIEPNLECIENVKSKKELKANLLVLIKRVDSKSIKFDLEGLIEDRNFIVDIGENIKGILITLINQ